MTAGTTVLTTMDRFADAKARLVELRLGSSGGPTENGSDFTVLVAVDIVKYESSTEALRQSSDASLKQRAVGQTFEALIRGAGFDRRTAILLTNIGEFVEGNFVKTFLAEAHQNGVASDAVQPSRKCGVALKIAEAAKDCEERFLSQIFRKSRITNHAKTERIDAVTV